MSLRAVYDVHECIIDAHCRAFDATFSIKEAGLRKPYRNEGKCSILKSCSSVEFLPRGQLIKQEI